MNSERQAEVLLVLAKAFSGTLRQKSIVRIPK